MDKINCIDNVWLSNIHTPVKYGKLQPKNGNSATALRLLKEKNRKYFDSGDYALAQAAKKNMEKKKETEEVPKKSE